MEHLERDEPLVPDVAREVHGGHAAAPELALDDVAIGEGGSEQGESTAVTVWLGSDAWNVAPAAADCQQTLFRADADVRRPPAQEILGEVSVTVGR